MRELKILATLKKILSHTCSQQPPVSLPPIWPPCSPHLATSARPHFHPYFRQSCSIIFLQPDFYWICKKFTTNPSVRKGGQIGGRETGGCCEQVCERIFLDTHVSLAPTHVCLSVGPSVRPSHFRISILSASLVALREKLKREDPNYFFQFWV